MDKENVITHTHTHTHTYTHTHTHTVEYYSALIKKEILPLAITWRNLEDFMLHERSQTQKYKYAFACGI